MFGHGLRLLTDTIFHGRTHPWDGVLSNVWVADPGYVNGSSVSTWSPQAGSVSLVAGTNPVQANSAFVPSATRSGIIGSQSGDYYLTGNAVASSMGGPFSYITSFRCDSNGTSFGSHLFGFGNSSVSDTSNLILFTDPTSHVRVQRRINGGGEVNLTTTAQLMVGNPYVLTVLYDGTNATIRLNGVNAPFTSSIGGTGLGTGTANLNEFTVFSFLASGSPIGAFGGETFRFIGLAPGVVLGATDYTAIENYLMSEFTPSPLHLLATGSVGSAVRCWQSDSGVDNVLGTNLCDSWTGLISGVAATQASGGLQPAISVGDVATYLQFTAGNYLEEDTLSSTFNGGVYTVVFQFVCSAIGTGQILFASANNSNNTDFVHFSVDSSSRIAIVAGSVATGNVTINTTQTVTPGNKYVLSFRYNGSLATIRINGVTSSVNGSAFNYGTPTMNNFTIGVKKNNTGIVTPDFSGKLGAFICWSSVLSLGDLSPVENALMANW